MPLSKLNLDLPLSSTGYYICPYTFPRLGYIEGTSEPEFHKIYPTQQKQEEDKTIPHSVTLKEQKMKINKHHLRKILSLKTTMKQKKII